ncbi:MAG: hypothetical protein WEC84_03325 [Candidatus Andersenbacteria bacterium]
MTHYICPVCHGVSDKPKVCETPNCSHQGKDLVECSCQDGKHEGTAAPVLSPEGSA